MAEEGVRVDALAAYDPSGVVSPFNFTLRPAAPKDVTIKILFCGICHSDLHQVRNDWKIAVYPLVPGHEIVGVVKEVGSEVTKFKPGDHAGVGCMVETCGNCECCEQNLEQYCKKVVFTYNSKLEDGSMTYGGFASHIRVNERILFPLFDWPEAEEPEERARLIVLCCSFALKIPDNLPLEGAAPLLCAGITVYSPMKYFGMDQAGKSMGVVGLGGLGHMAIKFGKAFGMKVTVISTSPHKEREAKEGLGADHFLLSKDPSQMKKAAGTLDYIVDTVSADHSMSAVMSLLKVNGKAVVVGIPAKPFDVGAVSFIHGRKSLSGSSFGSIQETQDMFDFCGEHGLTADIELVSFQAVNTAFERLAKSDVKYRFVIDVGRSKL